MPNFVTKRPMFAAKESPAAPTPKATLSSKELAPRVDVKVPQNEVGMRKQLGQLQAGLSELKQLKSKPLIERPFVTSLTHKNPATSDPKQAAQLAAKQAASKATSGPDLPWLPLPYKSHSMAAKLSDKHYPSPAAAKLLENSHKGGVPKHPVETKYSGTAAGRGAEGSKSEKTLTHPVEGKGGKAVSATPAPLPDGKAQAHTPRLDQAKQPIAPHATKESARSPQNSVPTPRVPARPNFNVPVRTGADKEAFQQIMEPRDLKKASHLPSAARLGQLVQANTIYMKENGKEHPELAKLVGKIQSGQRREVADMPAGRIDKLVHSAMGGKQAAAQKVNTPEVTRMIDRHSTLANVYQSQRNERELHRHTDGNTIRGIKRPQPAGAQAPLASHGAAGGGGTVTVQHNNKQSSSSRHDTHHTHNILADMLANNEEAHMGAVMSSDRDQAAPRKTDRVLKQGEQAKSSVNPAPLMPDRGVASSLNKSKDSAKLAGVDGPSPKGGNAAKALGTAMAEASGGKHSGKQTLEGTLKISGTNGQSIGQASLTGELK